MTEEIRLRKELAVKPLFFLFVALPIVFAHPMLFVEIFNQIISLLQARECCIKYIVFFVFSK